MGGPICPPRDKGEIQLPKRQIILRKLRGSVGTTLRREISRKQRNQPAKNAARLTATKMTESWQDRIIKTKQCPPFMILSRHDSVCLRRSQKKSSRPELPARPAVHPNVQRLAEIERFQRERRPQCGKAVTESREASGVRRIPAISAANPQARSKSAGCGAPQTLCDSLCHSSLPACALLARLLANSAIAVHRTQKNAVRHVRSHLFLTDSLPAPLNSPKRCSGGGPLGPSPAALYY